MAEPSVLIHHCKLAVATETGVSVADQVGRSKLRRIVRPRQIAMALARELTPQSRVRIGQLFGGRHAQVVDSACDMVAHLRRQSAFDQLYRRCRARAIAEAAAPQALAHG